MRQAMTAGRVLNAVTRVATLWNRHLASRRHWQQLHASLSGSALKARPVLATVANRLESQPLLGTRWLDPWRVTDDVASSNKNEIARIDEWRMTNGGNGDGCWLETGKSSGTSNAKTTRLRSGSQSVLSLSGLAHHFAIIVNGHHLDGTTSECCCCREQARKTYFPICEGTEAIASRLLCGKRAPGE